MTVLVAPSNGGEADQAAVALGSGLIGQSVTNALAMRGFRMVEHRAPRWEDGTALRQQIAAVADSPPVRHARHVDWVWAAGKAGFSATSAQTVQEMSTFRLFLDTIIQRSNPLHRNRLHLISSAGGLFEGQLNVHPASAPTPLRPYGELKLAQETEASRVWGDSLHIYRPSSVYGFIRRNQRVGLITALLSNTLSHRTTFITGRFDTLRDYVWADDVGTYIARRIHDDHLPHRSVCLLASGRPASINEIRHLVQKATQRPAYLRFLGTSTNADSNTYAAAALPRGWNPSSLHVNIRRILTDARCTGSIRPQIGL